MINKQLDNQIKESSQFLLTQFNDIFRPEIGKHKDYKVKLHVDPTVKPVVSPPCATLYHMRERISLIE